MSRYRSAIVGTGPRAAEHALAYRQLDRGALVAVAGRDPQRLAGFGARFDLRTYRDYRDLLAAERVDLLHVVTPPDLRLPVLEAAAAAGVPAVVVEKPIAIGGEDHAALRKFAARTAIKIAVNHQLHYHDSMVRIREAVDSGALGEIHLITASARHNLAYQGTHLVQAVQALLDWRRVESVFAQAGGPDGMHGRAGHVAPDLSLSELAITGGVRAFLRCGDNAPLDDPDRRERHLHQILTAYGDRGWARWSMFDWAIATGDHQSRGRVDYWTEDSPAQARFTDAMFDWLADDEAVHPCHLERALDEFALILASYLSAVTRQVCSQPTEGDPERLGSALDRLRTALETERSH